MAAQMTRRQAPAGTAPPDCASGQRVGGNADAVSIGILRRYRISESEGGCISRPADKPRVPGGRGGTYGEAQTGVPAGSDRRAESYPHPNGFAGAVSVPGLRAGHDADGGYGDGYSRGNGNGGSGRAAASHQMGSTGRLCGMAQIRRQPGSIHNRSPIERQSVGRNADAVAVRIARLHGIAKSQRIGAAARSIGRVASSAADGEGHPRRAGCGYILGEANRHGDGFAGAIGAVGLGSGSDADVAHRGLLADCDGHLIRSREAGAGSVGYGKPEGQVNVGVVGVGDAGRGESRLGRRGAAQRPVAASAGCWRRLLPQVSQRLPVRIPAASAVQGYGAGLRHRLVIAGVGNGRPGGNGNAAVNLVVVIVSHRVAAQAQGGRQPGSIRNRSPVKRQSVGRNADAVAVRIRRLHRVFKSQSIGAAAGLVIRRVSVGAPAGDGQPRRSRYRHTFAEPHFYLNGLALHISVGNGVVHTPANADAAHRGLRADGDDDIIGVGVAVAVGYGEPEGQVNIAAGDARRREAGRRGVGIGDGQAAARTRRRRRLRPGVGQSRRLPGVRIAAAAGKRYRSAGRPHHIPAGVGRRMARRSAAVNLVAGAGPYRGMIQIGRQFGSILNRSPVQLQGVGPDAHPVGVGIAGLDDIVESQGIRPRAGSVAGVAGGSADGQAHPRRPVRSVHIHNFAELRLDGNRFALRVSVGHRRPRRAGYADAAHRRLRADGNGRIIGVGVAVAVRYHQLECQIHIAAGDAGSGEAGLRHVGIGDGQATARPRRRRRLRPGIGQSRRLPGVRVAAAAGQSYGATGRHHLVATRVGRRMTRRRAAVHFVAGAGRRQRMAQIRRQFGSILNRSPVERQSVGRDADAVSIAVSRLHRVAESQRISASAGSVVGVLGGRADSQAHPRRPPRRDHIHNLAELRLNRNRFAPRVSVGDGRPRRTADAHAAHRRL